MAQMGYGRHGRIVVTVHTATPPPNDEWNGYLVFCAELVAVFRDAPLKPCSIVFTDGAAPNTEQRRAFLDIVARHPFTSAIVTSSRVTRGVVTLISWFAPGVQAFSPTDVDGILRHAGVERHALKDLVTLASRLAADCHGIVVLDRFIAAAAPPVARVG
jgi:hypothetical protein